LELGIWIRLRRICYLPARHLSGGVLVISSVFVDMSVEMNISEPDIYARALSFADNCIINLAHKEHADMVLSDDRLLRKLAVIEGFRVVGTLGVLLHAKKKKLLTAKKALSLLDQLVEEHNFRISTRVYETVRKAIDG
jgi:predicted nucleic acid-binding protein